MAIVSDAIAGRNGVGTYYQDLIAHLRPRVRQVELVGPTLDRSSDLESFAFPMPGDRTQRLIWPRRRRLAQRLDEQRPNLIVIPSLGPFSYFGLRYAQRNGLPLVLVNHTNFDQLLSLYWPGWVSRPAHWGLARINRWLIRQASAVAAMNVEALEEARQQGASMVRVMGTPIPPEFMQSSQPSPRPTPRRAIFVGRLATEKGIDQITQAVRAMPETEFTVVGDGPRRGEIERTAAACPNLTYAGWLSRDQVREAIDASDVLMLPSTVETFGTVALEALARQRYVLVRRECGIAKWSSVAKGLFYIEAGETLEAALGRLCRLPRGERDEIAQQSWQAVRRFNDHTIRVWLKFLVDAAGLAESSAEESSGAPRPRLHS